MVCCVTLHNICVSSSLLKRPGTRKCTNAAILPLRQMYVPFHLPMQFGRFRWNESTDEDYTNTFNYPKHLLRYYHLYV